MNRDELDLEAIARPAAPYQKRISESWLWFLVSVRDLNAALDSILSKRPRSRRARLALSRELAAIHDSFTKGDVGSETARLCLRIRDAREELQDPGGAG